MGRSSAFETLKKAIEKEREEREKKKESLEDWHVRLALYGAALCSEEMRKNVSLATLRKNFLKQYMPHLLKWSGDGTEWFLCKQIKVNDRERFLSHIVDMYRDGTLEIQKKSEFSNSIFFCFGIDVAESTFSRQIREELGGQEINPKKKIGDG